MTDEDRSVRWLAKGTRLAGGFGAILGLGLAAAAFLSGESLLVRVVSTGPGLTLMLLGLVAACVGHATDAVLDARQPLRRGARGRAALSPRKPAPDPAAPAKNPTSAEETMPGPEKPRLTAPTAPARRKAGAGAHPIFSTRPPR